MPKDCLCLLLACQIDLVGQHQHRYALPFGNHQKAIQHSQVRRWLCAGKNRHHLIRVSDQDLLVLAFRIGRQP